MSISRLNLKSFSVGCFSLGLLVCVVGIVAVAWYKKTTDCFKDRPPLRTIDVTIQTSQGQQLITQLQKFADKNGFQSQVVYYAPNNENFSVWMKRKDVEVIVNSPFVVGEFKVGFYNNDCINPTVASDISDLVNDLKSLINEIPNVIITEEK